VWIDVDRLCQAPVQSDLRQKYPQFSHHVLMASRLTWEKNIVSAIRAWPEVLKLYPQAGLIVVGQGPEEGKLKQLVLDLDLTKSVSFESWTEDLPSYYKTATLFLNTSWYEGYGRTIAEALICGCPVVSTEVGAARELGAKLALPGHLAPVVIEVLSNRELPPVPQFLSLPEYQSAYRAALLA
jgi:glycosyltransferase involved in cell wall biosynthesis